MTSASGRTLGTCASTADESNFVAVWNMATHPARYYLGYYIAGGVVGYCWSAYELDCNTALGTSNAHTAHPWGSTANTFCSRYISAANIGTCASQDVDGNSLNCNNNCRAMIVGSTDPNGLFPSPPPLPNPPPPPPSPPPPSISSPPPPPSPRSARYLECNSLYRTASSLTCCEGGEMLQAGCNSSLDMDFGRRLADDSDAHLVDAYAYKNLSLDGHVDAKGRRLGHCCNRQEFCACMHAPPGTIFPPMAPAPAPPPITAPWSITCGGRSVLFPDVKYATACGECKPLVDNLQKYSSCDCYCASMGRTCVAAEEEQTDGSCTPNPSSITCASNQGGSGDGICECGTDNAATTPLDFSQGAKATASSGSGWIMAFEQCPANFSSRSSSPLGSCPSQVGGFSISIQDYITIGSGGSFPNVCSMSTSVYGFSQSNFNQPTFELRAATCQPFSLDCGSSGLAADFSGCSTSSTTQYALWRASTGRDSARITAGTFPTQAACQTAHDGFVSGMGSSTTYQDILNWWVNSAASVGLNGPSTSFEGCRALPSTCGLASGTTWRIVGIYATMAEVPSNFPYLSSSNGCYSATHSCGLEANTGTTLRNAGTTPPFPPASTHHVPPPPPSPPRLSYIETAFTASGDVSDYDANKVAAIKGIFAAAAGVTTNDVQLTIVSASVSVSAVITVDAASSGTALTSLSTGIMASETTLTAALSANSLLSTVTVAAITTAPLIAASPPPSPPPSSSDDGLSVGALVGIIVGALVCVAGSAVAAFFVMRKMSVPKVVDSGDSVVPSASSTSADDKPQAWAE